LRAGELIFARLARGFNMIIYLYGEDSYRSLKKLQELKVKFLEKNPGTAIDDFDAGNEEVNQILGTLGSGSLFSKKRLVILREALNAWPDEDQEKISQYLQEKKSDNNTLIAFWQREPGLKAKTLHNFLKKNSISEECNFLYGSALNQEAKKIAGLLKIKIDNDALQELILRTGSDLWKLESELIKIGNFCKNKIIQRQNILEMTVGNIDPSIFLTIETIAKKDRARAMELLHQHMAINEDEIYLAGMVLYQFRILLQVKEMQEKGLKEQEIGKISKIHPFVIKKTLPLVMHFTFKQLKTIFSKLTELDVALKTGKIEPKLALDMLVVGLTEK
jgi:DNA polymerase III subunit delta